eukprot:4753959-Amphidinium_carterae.2
MGACGHSHVPRAIHASMSHSPWYNLQRNRAGYGVAIHAVSSDYARDFSNRSAVTKSLISCQEYLQSAPETA